MFACGRWTVAARFERFTQSSQRSKGAETQRCRTWGAAAFDSIVSFAETSNERAVAPPSATSLLPYFPMCSLREPFKPCRQRPTWNQSDKATPPNANGADVAVSPTLACIGSGHVWAIAFPGVVLDGSATVMRFKASRYHRTEGASTPNACNLMLVASGLTGDGWEAAADRVVTHAPVGP